jgi:hypothetical protein
MSVPQAVFALWADVSQRVGQLVDSALDVEPAGGMSPAWKSLLSAYRVAPLAEETRFASAKNDKLIKGAPVAELEKCLGELATAARGQLMPLAEQLTQPQRELIERALTTFSAEALKRYRELAAARPKGMFSHAKKVAEQHQYGEKSKATGYVLRCPTCGGPRLQEELSCVFCGGELR